jgi:hypothetical protein
MFEENKRIRNATNTAGSRDTLLHFKTLRIGNRRAICEIQDHQNCLIHKSDIARELRSTDLNQFSVERNPGIA